jgi:MFS family permease
VEAGLIMIFQPVVMFVLSPIAGRISDRIEPRIVASIGMAFSALGLMMLIPLSTDTPLAYLIACLVMLGVGFGLFSSPNTNAVMSAVKKKYYGVASGIIGTMRLFGQMFSMGLVALIFSFYMGGIQITSDNSFLFLQSIHIAFIIFAILCVLGIAASLARGKVHEQEEPE